MHDHIQNRHDVHLANISWFCDTLVADGVECGTAATISQHTLLHTACTELELVQSIPGIGINLSALYAPQECWLQLMVVTDQQALKLTVGSDNSAYEIGFVGTDLRS